MLPHPALAAEYINYLGPGSLGQFHFSVEGNKLFFLIDFVSLAIFYCKHEATLFVECLAISTQRCLVIICTVRRWMACVTLLLHDTLLSLA